MYIYIYVMYYNICCTFLDLVFFATSKAAEVDDPHVLLLLVVDPRSQVENG